MKQTSTLNRLLSLALCLCMVLGMLPGIPLVTAKAAGTEGMITVEMKDSYGDGWNGNAIEIYENGTPVDTATIADRVSDGTWTTKLNPHGTYTFKWERGSFADETSFVIYVGTEEKFSAEGTDYYSGDTILTLEPVCAAPSFGEDYCCVICGTACAHPAYEDSVCTECGYVCVDHSWVKGVCSLCSASCAHESYADGLCTVCSYYQPAPQNGVGANGWPVYEISNASQLLWFADYVNSNEILEVKEYTNSDGIEYDYITSGSVNARLMADIDLTGMAWSPIGTSYVLNNSYYATNGYNGVFEGGGHTVSGISYSVTGTWHVFAGFFGEVFSATITDLTVKGSFYAECTKNGYIAYVGGIAACDWNDWNGGRSLISNCSFIGTVSGKGASHACVGGLLGASGGIVESCFVSAQVEKDAQYGDCGALVGSASATFTNCCYDSTVCSLGAVMDDPAEGVTGLATEKVRNGTAADLLGEKWGQDIGTDLYPVLGGKPVYLATTGCVTYSNTDAEPVEKDHVGGEPTCTEKGICTACGESYGEPLGHVIGSDMICTRCLDYDNPKQNGVGANGWPVYEIYNASQLMWFANYVNSNTIIGEEQGYTPVGEPYIEYIYACSVNAVLMADIDLSGFQWTPIGVPYILNGTYVTSGYSGTFDGNGFTVSGMECSVISDEQVYAGFFGMADGCTIKNLTVKGSVYGELTDTRYACVGGLLGDGEGDSVISDCAFIGTVSGKGQRVIVGGLAGIFKGTMTDCFVSAQVEAEGTAIVFCGAIGGTGDATYTNCYYDSTVCSLDAHEGSAAAGTAGATAEELASGKIAYLLGEGWGQKLGTDAYPVLGGDAVYQAQSCQGEIFDAYSNTKGVVKHNYSYGVCVDCDAVCDHSQGATSIYEWYPSEDGTCYVYATWYCAGCGVYMDSVGEEAVLSESVEATDCLHPGSNTYTHTYTLNGVEYSESYTVEIFSNNHQGQPENGFCSACGGYEAAVWNEEDYVYEIYNAGQLYWYAQQLNKMNAEIYVRLMADIVIPENAPEWVPINASYAYFNGNFKTISGLKCVGDENDTYVGMFGNEIWWYEISNLHITDSYFEGQNYVGAVAASMSNGGSITNCYVTNTTVKGEGTVGTLVGYLGMSHVINCYVDTDNLVGSFSEGYGSIENSYYLSETETEDGGKTAEQFESGEVAFLLQSAIPSEDVYDDEWNVIGTVTPEIWGQTIGEDDFPVLKGQKVYYGYKYCDVQGYTNAPKDGVTPHNFVNGVCDPCGEICDHANAANGSCPDCGIAIYTVTVDPELEGGMPLVSGFTAIAGADYTGIIERNNYYNVGAFGFDLYVYIGGERITEFSMVNGELKIPGDQITGDIYITGRGNMDRSDEDYGCFFVCAGALTPYEITWTEDCGSATLTVPCVFCDETQQITLDSTCVTTDPDCTHAGTATYTVTYNDITVSKMVETGPATGVHNHVDGVCPGCGDVLQVHVNISWNGTLIEEWQWTEDYGTRVLLPTGPTPEGYTFKGYAESPNGSIVCGDDEAYTFTKDVTLYSVFEANTYSITWDLDGGSFTSVDNATGTTVTVKDGDTTAYTFAGGNGTTYSMSIAVVAPTKANHKLVGFVDQDGKEYEIAKRGFGFNGQIYQLDGISVTKTPYAQTFTAVWEQTACKVTFAGEGTEYLQDLEVAPGTVIDLPCRWYDLFCAGRVFLGYTTEEGGSGERYMDCTQYTVTEDVTFYPRWAEISVGGVAMNSGEYVDNNGTVSTAKPEGGYAYFENGTLTLHDFTYSGEGYLYYHHLGAGLTSTAAVYYGLGDLQLVLEGENALTNTTEEGYGVCIENAGLTVSGDGSLTVDADYAAVSSSYGMTLESGALSLTAGGNCILTNGSLTVNGGQITAQNTANTTCIQVMEDFHMNGGTVEVTAPRWGVDVVGALTVTGGTLSVNTGDPDVGALYAGSIVIENVSLLKPVGGRVDGGNIVDADGSNTQSILIGTFVEPSIKLIRPSLSFEGEIYYNFYFTTSGIDNSNTEMGLVIFDGAVEDGTIESAMQIVPGYEGDPGSTELRARTEGIPTKKLGDKIYFKVYAKLADGTYVYSKLQSYSALDYAMDRLANSENESLKALCVAMLNYGAAAQTYFGYNTDNLMNAGLTDEQKALVNAYDSSMINGVGTADKAKVGEFANNKGYSSRRASVSFEGAFNINYYLTPKYTPANGVTVYYWTQETYDSVDVLTRENADGILDVADSGKTYKATLEGIAAKAIDTPVYVAGVYEYEGVSYATGVMVYSVAAYCANRIDNGSAEMKPLAEATAVYGYYAKNYFANIAE